MCHFLWICMDDVRIFIIFLAVKVMLAIWIEALHIFHKQYLMLYNTLSVLVKLVSTYTFQL